MDSYLKKEIYLSKLELKTENKNNMETTFVDLDMKIINKKFQISFYDKRDSFNIPSRIFYSSIGAEMLRIGRANNINSTFNNVAKTII